jgi:hypothetical protein
MSVIDTNSNSRLKESYQFLEKLRFNKISLPVGAFLRLFTTRIGAYTIYIFLGSVIYLSSTSCLIDLENDDITRKNCKK